MEKADLLVAPPITPLSGTLLDVATIHEGIENQVTDDLFESYNCLTTDRRATWPCPPVAMAAPVHTTGTATTGGTIPAGTYRIRVTAVEAVYGETTGSTATTTTTTGTTSTLTASWTAIPGASGYNVYVSPLGGGVGTETFQGTTTGTAYTLTAPPVAGGRSVPTTNTATAPQPTKTFQRPTWVDGARFAVYAGVECKRFGASINREEGLAAGKEVFLARESFGVERALIETVLQGATDLTPAGGAVSVEQGLALLEGDAATKYAGVPTLHLPRRAASLLANEKAIESLAGKFYTMLGSKVAAGGGYDASNISPSATVPTAGEMWLYSSGEVLVLRGDIIAKEELNRDTNETIDLIERPYIVTVDCYKSAVRVKVA